MRKHTSKPQRKRKRLRLFESSRDKKIGLPPGTPVHLGSKHDFTPYATLLQYSLEGGVNEIAQLDPSTARANLKSNAVNWINIEGIHEVHFVQTLGNQLDLHPLTQEDLVNTSLRPQFESFPGYYFFSLKMLYLSSDRQLRQEHLSLILKGNTVVSFQETPGDVFGRIRERIRGQTGKLSARGADHLVYMLLDSIVDGYYQVVDGIGEQIDHLEDELRFGAKDEQLARIYDLRREVLFLRKNIVPVRDLLGKVQVEGVFQENTKIYLKDLTDHITQVTESLLLSMEMSTVLIDTYHSMQNQKLNAIMKTLTMISTVFLPLNFIAGIYGMNFEHMPELKWQFSYPVVLGLMVVVAIGMLGTFVRRGWLLEGRFKYLAFNSDDSEVHSLESKPNK